MEFSGSTGANDNKLRFALGDISAGFFTLDAASALSSGRWHHIVAAYDGSDTIGGMKVYADGSSISMNVANNNEGSPLGTVPNWAVGYWRYSGDGTGYYYSWTIDDIV